MRLAPPGDREDGIPRRAPQCPAIIERIAKAGRLGLVAAEVEKLPYSSELWDSGGHALERVLALALNAQLARAIFHAAQEAHPEAQILLRRGARTVAHPAG
ncbi:MAG: hypothetical protein ACM3PO_04200 [Betaproteobacteria bacterium]